MSYDLVRLYHPEMCEGDIDVLLVHLPHPRDVRFWPSHNTLVIVNNELQQHYYVRDAPAWAEHYRRQGEHWRENAMTASARLLVLAEVWQSRCQLDLPFPTGNVLHRRKD